MKALLLVLMLGCFVCSSGVTRADEPSAVAGVAYAPTMTGRVEASGLAGVEPDGDPLYKVLLRTRLSASHGIPAANLIVSSYLENFKPDTTPVLPDLLSPRKTAVHLGGFLQGKALLTDDAGDALYIGSFLGEAFLDNSNHTVMTFYGTGKGSGGRGALKGAFDLRAGGYIRGSVSGTLVIPPSARQQLATRAGTRMKPLKEIIGAVTVKPSYMRGLASTSTSAPLKTRYGSAIHSNGPERRLSPWTIVAGVGSVLSLAIAAWLYLIERRRNRKNRASLG